MAKAQAKKPWEVTDAVAEEAAAPSTAPVSEEAAVVVSDEPVVESVVPEEPIAEEAAVVVSDEPVVEEVVDSTDEASDAPTVEEDAGEGKEPVSTPIPTLTGELLHTVVVVVPKTFILNLDHHKSVTYQAGTQRMERSHADHWWSKANGVAIFEG
jgi:hypothetical protein